MQLIVGLLASLISASAEAQDQSRSFFMGFSPFNHSWIEEEQETTYRLIAENGDLILFHLDHGIPWSEALAGGAYHPNVEAKLADMAGRRRPGQRVFLAVTPIDFGRADLAAAWGRRDNMDRRGAWRGASFDDPEVLRAYLNFCRDLIARFQPDYFAYAIEANLLERNNPEAYAKFIPFAAQVYSTLKAEFPDLPIFATFYLGPPEESDRFRHQVTPLLPSSDILAISSYPYMSIDGPPRRVDEIPGNWFAQIRDIAPGKRFAIAETGFIAEPMEVAGVEFSASAEDQARYVALLLAEANRLDAEFVVWFLPADYDELWTVLKWMVAFNPLYRAWKDIGLWDGDLRPRPGLAVWNGWRARPRR